MLQDRRTSHQIRYSFACQQHFLSADRSRLACRSFDWRSRSKAVIWKLFSHVRRTKSYLISDLCTMKIHDFKHKMSISRQWNRVQWLVSCANISCTCKTDAETQNSRRIMASRQMIKFLWFFKNFADFSLLVILALDKKDVVSTVILWSLVESFSHQIQTTKTSQNAFVNASLN